ncbi:hypothetical protein K466DRAFT_263459 [Polyporus arcularius HHB13444]|uniref:Uncharacterized protein n=1 Tax=Polyporus arcularius HHB13444 TaxID=1314778 RepID=A0A5C3P554_9APHY|nr:hypothetical protein K466DRAFT_263459 [Polyporus arcularius HHB13444]
MLVGPRAAGARSALRKERHSDALAQRRPQIARSQQQRGSHSRRLTPRRPAPPQLEPPPELLRYLYYTLPSPPHRRTVHRLLTQRPRVEQLEGRAHPPEDRPSSLMVVSTRECNPAW